MKDFHDLARIPYVIDGYEKIKKGEYIVKNIIPRQWNYKKN